MTRREASVFFSMAYLSLLFYSNVPIRSICASAFTYLLVCLGAGKLPHWPLTGFSDWVLETPPHPRHFRQPNQWIPPCRGPHGPLHPVRKAGSSSKHDTEGGVAFAFFALDGGEAHLCGFCGHVARCRGDPPMFFLFATLLLKQPNRMKALYR